MQSFGDDTLFAHINIEKECRVLREENCNDVDKYSERSSLVSKLANEDVVKSKLSHPTYNTKEIIKQSESDFVKCFEDSIILPKINGRKNVSSTSSTLKGGKIMSSQKNRSPSGNEQNINTINSTEKHSPDVINSVKNRDKSSVQNCHKNGSRDNMYNAMSGSSVAMSASIDTTCDREISNIILSRALCTQERCKLASWGLPPNILQVLYCDIVFNKCL